MENNIKRVYDYLKAADTYYLATVEDDQPIFLRFINFNIFIVQIY